MKRAISPVTNSAGLSASGMAVYAAAVMLYNVANHHGVIDVPVIVAAVAAIAAWYTRTKVTPVADPRDGNGKPLQVADEKPPLPVIAMPPAAPPEKTLIPPPQAGM